MDLNYTNPAFDSSDVVGTATNSTENQGKRDIHDKSIKLNGIQIHNPDEENDKTVALLGSGDMAMGLAINLLKAKLRPVVASRNPERARTRLQKMQNIEIDVTTIAEGVAMADIIVIAIPSDHHHSLPKDLLKEKILIDISNRLPKSPRGGPSLAEKLQTLLPDSHVVKAFNTISSYALSQGNIQGSKEVPICGDSEWARKRVASLVRDIGLVPIDQGDLRNARQVEDIPLSFFPEWKIASILTLCLFIFYFLIVLFQEQLCPNIDNKNKTEWDLQPFNFLPLLNMNYTLGYTAGTLLLLTYLPGAFAAYIQLFRGTKYSQFPDWLDEWMKSRKQFGLMALLLGSTHGCAVIFTQMTMGMIHPISWHEQLYCLLGPVLAATLAILGVTSLPSVSARLTWREFSVIHRYLGWTTVILVTLHGGFSNWGLLLVKPGCVVLPSGAQIFVALSLSTVAVKIPLLIPCLDSYLTKIRNGYERSQTKVSQV